MRERIRPIALLLRSLFHRRRVYEEIDEELAFHIEMEAGKYMREGMDPETARRRAMVAFGGVERHREEVRDTRGTGPLEDLWMDLRYGARSLRRNIGFTAVAVLTLALGIGANTAVYSIIDGVLLRPLPYPEPDRLVAIAEANRESPRMHVTAANFADWQSRSRALESMALHTSSEFTGPTTVLGGSSATRALVTGVTSDFFRVFRTAPAVGRGFDASEVTDDGAAAAIVSHGFWRAQLGSDADLSRHTVDLWGERHQVVGVMPRSFTYPAGTEIWLPVTTRGDTGRRSHNWVAVGRLAPGASVESAHGELARITAGLKAEHGGDMDAETVVLHSLHEELVGNVREPLLLLLGAAALVLLIACINLASTLLARAQTRGHEMAVRSSLGAGSGRLVRQLLTESAMLAALGAVAGLALTYLLLRALPALAPELPRVDTLGINGRVLGAAVLLALVTTILFGMIPARRAVGAAAVETLRSGRRVGSQSYSRGPWRLLVGGEVALALVLLVASGLLIRSLQQVLSIEPGFRTDGAITLDLALPDSKYPDDAARSHYFERLTQVMSATPGVEAAGLINHPVLGGVSWNGSFDIEGRGETGSEYADYRVASAGYFAAQGIPVLRGRDFQEQDRPGAPDAVIIDRTMAERFWPGEDPLGKRIRNLANDGWIYPDRWLTIVGVVGPVRHASLTDDPRPTVYVNILQRPNRAMQATAVVATTAPASRIAPTLRSRIHAIDPDVPLEIRTMESRLSQSVADRRFMMLVLGVFAAIALALAGVGIYGVVSYAVAQRTREIGIRVALGADPRRVRDLMIRDSMLVVVLGLGAGLVVSLLLARLLAGLLFGVAATDAATYAAVALLLAGAAWFASWIPARRATRVDPIVTLRAE